MGVIPLVRLESFESRAEKLQQFLGYENTSILRLKRSFLEDPLPALKPIGFFLEALG